MTHQFNTSIFREYDIRGTFNKTFFTADAYEIGLRFATILHQCHKNPLICIGRDGRLSSPDLSLALIQGLRDAGANILDVGVGPTPMLYYATKITPAVAGVMVTGSHNPPEDNGLKLTLKDFPFFGPQIQELKDTVPQTSETPGSLEFIDLRDQYLDRLLIDAPKKTTQKLKIVWDCGNGAAGEIIEMLTARLQNHSILLNTTIDGTFPAHPADPAVEENLVQLCDTVAAHNCDIGIAFDGDADRIGVIDKKGRVIWGDQLLCLLAEDVLRHNPGAKIIADVKSSQALFNYIEKLEGIAVMGKTGHSNIKTQLREIGAALAGEMSGHIFFADTYYGYDDAIYAAIRLISFLETQSKSLHELYDQLPKYYNTPEIRIPCDDQHKFEIVQKIRADLEKNGTNFIAIDGVRVTTESGWWLVRASNTQSILVARCEAYTKEQLPHLIQHMKTVLEPYVGAGALGMDKFY
ncbi:phosphomannomutase/phosphoglucomutase [Candidatus Paracaedibacter symbiosus]|uniref:phosphomannomutase/phosphoglucomutase n=1 Tax=Candidatus Paracaedibacter symbiosus TaxID=244582 RepID=UPI0005097F5C|nr:phosphomannomutase/phosphoglucomutase [Candidatus Paracaedibacter symbiosus]